MLCTVCACSPCIDAAAVHVSRARHCTPALMWLRCLLCQSICTSCLPKPYILPQGRPLTIMKLTSSEATRALGVGTTDKNRGRDDDGRKRQSETGQSTIAHFSPLQNCRAQTMRMWIAGLFISRRRWRIAQRLKRQHRLAGELQTDKHGTRHVVVSEKVRPVQGLLCPRGRELGRS